MTLVKKNILNMTYEKFHGATRNSTIRGQVQEVIMSRRYRGNMED